MALDDYWKRIGRRGRYGVAVAGVLVFGLGWWGLAGMSIGVGRIRVTVPVLFPTRGELIEGKRYLTREQTLGLALYNYYIEGDCGVNDNEDGMWSEPLRFLHPKHLGELRRMGSSLKPEQASHGALILMLGQIGQEPEVKLVDAALERFQGRELEDDPYAWDRLRAYQDAAIQLAKRDVPGGRKVVEKLLNPEWWERMDLSYREKRFDENVNRIRSRGEAERMRSSCARAGIEWVEIPLERRVAKEAVKHREEPGPPRELERLEAQYLLHEGEVERAVGGVWDYEKGLLAIMPGRTRE